MFVLILLLFMTEEVGQSFVNCQQPSALVHFLPTDKPGISDTAAEAFLCTEGKHVLAENSDMLELDQTITSGICLNTADLCVFLWQLSANIST